MYIVNKTRRCNLAWRADRATTPPQLLRGLRNRKELDAGEGLLLVPCHAITMQGMAFPIDLVFIDRAGIVTEIVRALAPGIKSLPSSDLTTYAAIELPVGTIERTGTERGDEIITGA